MDHRICYCQGIRGASLALMCVMGCAAASATNGVSIRVFFFVRKKVRLVCSL